MYYCGQIYATSAVLRPQEEASEELDALGPTTIVLLGSTKVPVFEAVEPHISKSNSKDEVQLLASRGRIAYDM